MKKLIVFAKLILSVAVLLVAATLLLKVRRPLDNPVLYGKQYHGGSGGGYASAEYTGRLDGSGAKR